MNIQANKTVLKWIIFIRKMYEIMHYALIFGIKKDPPGDQT